MNPRESPSNVHVGGGQNYGPFWGTRNIRCRITIEIQKETIILTTTQCEIMDWTWINTAVIDSH